MGKVDFHNGTSEDASIQTLSTITRQTLLEHPLLAPRLEDLFLKAREQNSKLPKTLKEFVDQTIEGRGEVSFISKGRIKWQAALAHGLTQLRADA